MIDVAFVPSRRFVTHFATMETIHAKTYRAPWRRVTPRYAAATAAADRVLLVRREAVDDAWSTADARQVSAAACLYERCAAFISYTVV